MAQPVSANQFTYIGTVGSVVLSDTSAVFKGAVLWGTYVGTVIIYNSPTVAGAGVTNVIGTIGLPTTSIPTSLEMAKDGIQANKGLVYTATGTPNLTLIWDK